MDQKLESIIQTLLLNIATLNEEIHRLSRTEQFRPTPQCFQLIEHIRDHCTGTLQLLNTVERRLYRRYSVPPPSPAKPAISSLSLKPPY